MDPVSATLALTGFAAVIIAETMLIWANNGVTDQCY